MMILYFFLVYIIHHFQDSSVKKIDPFLLSNNHVVRVEIECKCDQDFLDEIKTKGEIYFHSEKSILADIPYGFLTNLASYDQVLRISPPETIRKK